MKKWLGALAFCLISFLSFGQLNLTAGYSLSFLDASTHDAIIQMHEESLGDAYTEKFKPLDVLHGLDLGIEYRWESVAWEVGWRVKRNRQVGSGNYMGTPFTNKLRYSMGSFYTGIVQYFGPVRLSATVDYNYIRNHLEFARPAVEAIFKDDSWGSVFSLGVVLNGSGPVSIGLLPFIQKNWSDFNLGPVQAALNGTSGSPVKESYFNYGITIMFLNGPHD